MREWQSDEAAPSFLPSRGEAKGDIDVIFRLVTLGCACGRVEFQHVSLLREALP